MRSRIEDQGAVSGSDIGQVGFAAITTNRDEVRLPADIMFGIEASYAAMDGHTEE